MVAAGAVPMEWLFTGDYWLARLVFQRAVAAVYLVAFLTAANQFRPLLGEQGLLPTPRFLDRVDVRSAPSLFHLRYSDRLAMAVAWAGVGLSTAVVVGLPQAGPVWLPMLVWFLLWGAYLSIVNVGQVFYSFGWESILLEAGFLAMFLGSERTAPPVLVIWLIRWLVFRVEFGAGLIKLRGDRCWRDLTCLDYHHETQPLPGPFSWHFHHLPPWLHKVEVVANHAAQLVAPVGLFAPQPVAAVAGGVIVVTQAWLVASGNFSWLNVLTIALTVVAFDDRLLGAFLPLRPPEQLTVGPVWLSALVVAATLLVLVLSWWPVTNMASRRQVMNRSFNPLRLVNTYGAFGAVTRQRREVVVEGTTDPEPSAATRWREYQFTGKPGDPHRRPPQVAPYHLRLDWLMWFAALSDVSRHPWFVRLVAKLLEGDEALLGLLATNPFPDEPPTHVRARLFRYRFTTPAERHETGAWWVRTETGEYLPPVSLDFVRARTAASR